MNIDNKESKTPIAVVQTVPLDAGLGVEKIVIAILPLN